VDSSQISDSVYQNIRETLATARSKVCVTINFAMVEAYWDIGKLIAEAAGDRSLAENGKGLLSFLSERLTKEFGRGFTVANLRNMRQFYQIFKNRYALRSELSWNHESELEQGLINKLQEFLLELGKGFSFVARQKRITSGGDHYYIDLVFYNYILKCFVLIDLKTGKLTHQDVGQMDFYVRLFEDKLKQPDDNATIGIILCSDRDENIVKYSVLADKENLFASKYKLYLPTEDELKRELEHGREVIERQKTLGEG